MMMEYLEFVDALLHQRKKKEKNFASALFLILIDQPIKVSFQKLSTEAVYILFFMHVSINLVQLNTFIAVPIEVQFVKIFGF